MNTNKTNSPAVLFVFIRVHSWLIPAFGIPNRRRGGPQNRGGEAGFGAMNGLLATDEHR
jgi:hypothetical protein